MISPIKETKDSNAACPVCERYIGPVSKCPYCDSDAPKPPFIRLLRWFAVFLAIGGLVLLYITAINKDIPLTSVSDITPTMNFAFVRMIGKVTRKPYVARDKQKISFILKDDTGDIRVTIYGSTAAQIAKQDLIPSKWSQIEVIGSLSVPANRDPVLYIKSPEHIIIPEK